MSPMPGIFCSVDFIVLFISPAIANVWPSLQLELGLGAARRERRECGSRCSTTALAKSSVLTSGLHLQVHAVADDGRREVEADAEFLELDRDADVRARALRDRNRELAAGEEAGFLAALGHEVRLGEALEQPARLQRLARARRGRTSG